MIKSVRPRLVTFDVTGTLLTTNVEKHYTEIGSQHGLSVDPDKLARSFKSNFKRLTLEHPIFGKHTGLGWENWWRTMVYNVFREQDRHSSDRTLDKVASSLIECYSTSRCWHKYSGTVDLLEYLKKQGIILGVISNFDERLDAILISARIRSYFSFVLTSYGLGVEKPSAIIFEEALKRSKELCGTTVLPQEALHIGDKIDNDYLGARNARWNAILIKRDDRHPIDETKVSSDEVFRNLDELLSHFDILFHDETY